MGPQLRTVAIIGYGAFGKLWADVFAPFTEVRVVSSRTLPAEDLAENVTQVSLEEAAKSDVVFITGILETFEQTCLQLQELVNPETIVADVCSVKVKPAEIMQRVLGGRCRLLATHPLLGPQSVKINGGTQGLKLVWHDLAGGPFPELESLCREQLGLEILKIDPDTHDKEMAWVHGLTFFVGRGLLQIDPPESKLMTNYYKELMDVVNLEKQQTMDLFMTIQRGNPYTDEIRQRLLDSLHELETRITKG